MEHGNKGQILRVRGEQRHYWGTGNIRNEIFDFLGGQGNKPIYFRGKMEQGGPPKYTVSFFFRRLKYAITAEYKPICIWFNIYMYMYKSDMHIDNMNSRVGVINFSKISSGRGRNWKPLCANKNKPQPQLIDNDWALIIQDISAQSRRRVSALLNAPDRCTNVLH